MTKSSSQCRPMRWSVTNSPAGIHSVSVVHYSDALKFTRFEVTCAQGHDVFILQVDKHIRRLDADLARFENELKEKLELSGHESAEGRSVKSKFWRLEQL